MKNKTINTSKRESFSLLELMVVLIIIGILLAFAVPSYRSSIERSKAGIVEQNLISIYNAQKRYRMNNMTYMYYTCDPLCTNLDISDILDINIADDGVNKGRTEDFTYTIINSTVVGLLTERYIARATRTSGECNNMTIEITELNSNVNRDPRCALW